MPVMRKSFRERSPVAMGVAGLVVVLALVVVAFNLTVLSGGTNYSAAFSDAGGLKPGEDVDVAGVKVGTVGAISLQGDHVLVDFSVGTHVHFGTRSVVKIGIATILGEHYIEIDPAGPGEQSPGAEIPTSRTVPDFDVLPALQSLAGQTQEINTTAMARAFNSLSAALEYSPQNLRNTLHGLQQISTAVSSRDTDLNSLLQHSSSLTSVLASRTGDLSALVSDGGLLLQQLNARSTVISSLLTGTISLSNQVTGLIRENHATLSPALSNLHRLIGVLEHNQSNLENAIRILGPTVTASADAIGNGRWFDGFVQNLLPLPISIKNSNFGTKSGGGSDTLPFLK